MLCNAAWYDTNPLIHPEYAYSIISAVNDKTHFQRGLPAKGVVQMNTKADIGAEVIEWFIISDL